MSQTETRATLGFAAWAATYDRTVAEEIEKYSGMPYHEVLERVYQAAAIPTGALVLDVGTGTGTLAMAIAKDASGCRVVGIDPTPAMLARARKNVKNAGLADRVELRQARAEALPFPDASFDVVISSLAMHHTQVRHSLPEMVRVLKPGGHLAIADPARNPRWDTALGCLVLPLMAVYYLATKRSWAMMRAEMEAYGQMFLKEGWEAMLGDLGLTSFDVQQHPHPTAQWYSSILIIRAVK